MLADSYRNKDYLYVETKAFQELKSVVEEMHWATLLGKPGDGKSATAVHLLLQYIEKGYEPVFLSSPRDWKMLISDSSSSRQIAVVDDMFGQSILDDNKNVGKWKSLIESMSRIVEQRKGNLLVICTSRRYIFKDIENALNKFVCFSKHAIVDMTDEKYKLSGDEKLAIFKQFAETYSIENSVWLEGNIRYVDPPHGFPHCVELYCRNVFLRIEGIAFFRNPVQYVQREIFNFRDNDRVKFLVLLLVLHNGDKLGLDTLDKLIEKTTDDDKILFQTAGVSLETAFPDVHRALTGLTNTYIKQNNDGSYSFSHHSLRETVADIYITANPSHAIRALEFQHIVAFTCTQNETAKGTVSKRSLPFEPLAKRMITEIKDGHVSTVCDCEVWSDQTFVIQFVKSIENEPLDFLEELICSKRTETRITESSGFLISLIQRKRFIAAKTFLENKSIGKALQNIDLWVKSLQEGLERAVYPSPSNPKIAMIRTLGSIRCGENMQKLDGSKLLSFMLLWSEVAIAKLDHTHINPQYGQPDTMSQYFHALAVQQFEVLCKKLLQAEVAVALLDHTHINPQYSQPGFLSQYFYVLANSTIDLPQFEVLCKKLLQAGADINQTDWNDVPAVFNCLTRFEDKGFDRLLCMVNNGADIHKRCKHGNIVLFTINRFNLRYILPRYYTPPPINNEPWSSKCVNILSKLSDLDVDFHCTDRAGSNALHIMCQRRPDEDSHVLLDYLLNKGVAAGAANKDGVVPLMLALKNNFSTDIIKTLAKNSPPNYVDKSGQNYFHYLFSSDCITNADEFCDKCDILIELGSSIGAKDNSDKPPIVHLMERYHNFYGGFDFVRMFHFFNEHGVDLHVKDGLGRNIVLCVLDWKITETESVYGLKHNFIQQINKPVTDQVSLLRFFQSIGLDLKLIDSNGRNALHHLFANILYNDKVIRNGDFYNTTKREFPEVSGNILKEIYDFLTEEIGLLPTTRNKNGKNAVMLALKNCAGFSWIIDLLNLEFPLHEDNKGRNYLHYLVKSRAPDCKFEALKTALSDKGLTVDDQILKNRPKQILD